MELSIAIHDFKNNILNTINESHLPLSVVNEIFLNFATQISQQAEKEYENDLIKLQQKQDTEKGGNDGDTTDST